MHKLIIVCLSRIRDVASGVSSSTAMGNRLDGLSHSNVPVAFVSGCLQLYMMLTVSRRKCPRHRDCGRHHPMTKGTELSAPAQTHGSHAEVQQCSHGKRKDKMHTGCCIASSATIPSCPFDPTAATCTDSNYCSTIPGVNVPLSHTACRNIFQLFTKHLTLMQYEPAAPSNKKHVIVKTSRIDPPRIAMPGTAAYH